MCRDINKRSSKRDDAPSLLAIIVPIVIGVIFGVSGVMGLLVGGLGSGFVLLFLWQMQGEHGIMPKNL